MKNTQLRIAVLLVMACISVAAAQEKALPTDLIPEGWSQVEEVREFAGPALYRHINGGSEMYLEHGFQTLFVQDFQNVDGEEIRLEIYVIDSPEGADAIMAENTKGLETSEDFGRIASVDPYQILFLQGPYYVSVTCFSDTEAVAAGMKAIARAADQYLTE